MTDALESELATFYATRVMSDRWLAWWSSTAGVVTAPRVKNAHISDTAAVKAALAQHLMPDATWQRSHTTRVCRILAEAKLARLNAEIAELRRRRHDERQKIRKGLQRQHDREAAQAQWEPDELAFVSERARAELAACGIDSLAELLSHTAPWYGAMLGWREASALEVCLRVRGLRLPKREYPL